MIHVVESAAARYLGQNTVDPETRHDDHLRRYQEQPAAMGCQASRQMGFRQPRRRDRRHRQQRPHGPAGGGAHGHRVLKDLTFGTTLEAVRHRINVPMRVIN